MKKLIFKKIIKDISVFFLISIISVATIVWIIQAVNFLDLISEDGHSLKVYFLYTLFSLPKIISKILPFIFMISLFYVIIKYEINNELIIYWINGITKLNFVNILVKISFVFFLTQIFLTSIVVPYTLDKGRSYFRTSNVDLFASIVKEKKFIDTVENLTIFVENKKDNLLKNILIKERINDNQSQIIIAEKGEIIGDNDSFSKKNIVLNQGKIINTEKNNQTVINFSKFNLDLSKFNTKTITHPKTQEMSSLNLFKCINLIKNFKKDNTDMDVKKNFFIGCNLEIFGPLKEEFLKRFFSPIFIILIGLSSSLIIMNSKDEKSYRLKNFIYFSFGIIFIIISEISLRYSGISMNNMITYLIAPISIFFIIYSYIYFNYQSYRGK
tara:strand:- start:522 stop:1673 length:1152 start_codon:yes stop_codon:yes gene_type:complete